MPKLYVGNISYTTTDEMLRGAFEQYGQVSAVDVIADRETGRSRGFAFIEMPDGKAAQEAIQGLNLSPMDGRNITVNEARPKENRGGGGGGGGRRRQW